MVISVASSADIHIQLILTVAGVLAAFALIVFFGLEMTNPEVYVLPDRTIGVMMTIIGLLLGYKSIHPYYRRMNGNGSGGSSGGTQ